MKSLNNIVFRQKMQYRDYSPDKSPVTVIQYAVGYKIYDFTWLQSKNIGGVVFLTMCVIDLVRIHRILCMLPNRKYIMLLTIRAFVCS